MNEGFTVFNERKVSGLIHGENFKKVSSFVGNNSMVTDMRNFGFNHTYSSLSPNVHNDNPDNAFSTVPYEKGYQLLTYIESLSGVDNFSEFMKVYLTKYAYQSI